MFVLNEDPFVMSLGCQETFEAVMQVIGTSGIVLRSQRCLGFYKACLSSMV